MTPEEEKRAKLFGKLREEPTPVITQVVRVAPAKPKKAEKTEETEHFNIFLPASLAKKVRLHKVETKMSIQQIVEDAVRKYLD